jgi:hypothetical protein
MKKKCITQSGSLNVSRVCVALVCAALISARAATITVTNTDDSGPGSLRQALTTANDGDTITFAVNGTIGLTSGGLLIAKNITISGPGSDQLSIDGNQAVLVFGIFPSNTVTISGLAIKNANAGAGIWNEQGTLTVSNCVLTSNSYDGIYNHGGTVNTNNCMLSQNSSYGLYTFEGTTRVTNCVVTGNSSGGVFNDVYHGPPPPTPVGSRGSMTIAGSTINGNSGAGVLNYAFLTILNSTLSGNSAGQDSYGGGISSGTFKALGVVTVVDSTISGNSAGSGGGIAINYGFISIINSTISGNLAANDGGGISNFEGRVQVANSTLSGNSAAIGGGIYNVAGQFGGLLEIGDTILNAGASGENILNNGGTVTSHGYNISSDDGGGYLNGPGDQINTNPLLGPLQDNGGPTLTHMPLPGSPAIDAGDPNFTPPPFHDQRGPCFYRVFGRPHGRIDVGSVEVQPQPRCPTPAPRPTPPPRP